MVTAGGEPFGPNPIRPRATTVKPRPVSRTVQRGHRPTCRPDRRGQARSGGKPYVYLEQIDIEDFRSIATASVHLNRDLTVLVGENSSGKSNFIEAIRLLTEPLDGRRTRFLSREDLFRRPEATMVTLRASYSGSTEDLAPYHHAIALGAANATFTLTYTPPPPTVLRGRTDWIAGNGADPSDPTPRARERIRHVYLPAGSWYDLRAALARWRARSEIS